MLLELNLAFMHNNWTRHWQTSDCPRYCNAARGDNTTLLSTKIIKIGWCMSKI